MIKTKPLPIDKVSPFWYKKGKSKPLREEHAKITNNVHPNIVCIAKKFSGKSTACIYLILKHFFNKYTHLNIFSGSLEKDEKNSESFDSLMRKYPRNVSMDPHFYDKEGNDILGERIGDADEYFELENDLPYDFPRTIFYFDDLKEEELRSPEMDQLFKTNRHHGIMNLLSAHNMKHISPTCRENTNILLLFKGMSLPALDDIYDWVNPSVNKKMFIRIYKKATDGERNFLMVDLDSKEMRKNLNELIIVE